MNAHVVVVAYTTAIASHIPSGTSIKRIKPSILMYCAHCIQLVNNVKDHELCKEYVWLAMSEELTRVREAVKKQYDFVPKGCTVDVREPLTRSVSR